MIKSSNKKACKNEDNQLLKKFEKDMMQWYPLGNDQFKLDHGEYYCKFFDRMGETYITAMLDKNKNIIASGGGVLRDIPCGKCWYLCDLKVHPEHRGKWLPFQMLCKMLYLRKYSNLCYGISMNKKDEENKVVKLANKFKLGLSYAGNLLIFSLDADEMRIVLPLIEKYKGKTFFISLKGIKDLILKSSGEPMKLLHLNFLNNYKYTDINISTIVTEPLDDHTHMFCLHEKDGLVGILKRAGITTGTTASIIQYGLDGLQPEEYSFIQTSEI